MLMLLRDLLAALRDNPRAADCAARRRQDDEGRPALLGEAWCTGEICLLVPRRLAARAAAEFMAGASSARRPAQTIGYATRLDSKVGKATRVIAMTHGVFLSRIQADPGACGRLCGPVRRGA